MGFPRKFKHLLELEADQVEKPESALLTYVVCAAEPDSCEWQGWMLEAVFSEGVYDRPAGKEPFDYLLYSISEQVCPRCGKEVYRTGVTYKAMIGDLYVYEEEHPDVETVPIEYDD